MQQANISSSYYPKSFRTQSLIFNKRNSKLFSPFKRQRSRSPSPLRYNQLPNTYNINNTQNTANPTSNIHAQNIKKVVDDIYIYPSGFSQLLKNEQRNIKQFKIQINRQKQRIDQDLSSFKVQLNHTLQDLRLSLHAHLDRVYQAYLQKTARFRKQVFQINRLKQQLELELGASSFTQLQAQIKMDTMNLNNKLRSVPQRDTDKNTGQSILNQTPNQNTLYHSINPINPSLNSNNLHLKNLQKISNMQIGNKQYKKYYILNYIAQLQKDKYLPLNQLQRQLVVLNLYQNGFYQSNQFIKVLAGLRDLLVKQTSKIYQSNYLYIRDINSILIKDKEENNKILDGLELSPYYFKPIYQNVVNNTNLNIQSNFISPNQVYNNQSTGLQKLSKLSGANLNCIISQSQQSLKVNSVQNINLAEQTCNIQIPNNQIALCGILINNQIALGLKNGIIQVTSCDGYNIATLKQHQANICTLAVLRTKNQNYLISGSDVGCCRVIVWDPVTWQPKHIFSGNHYAAISGLVDLQDDSHILSVGYDKRINIYGVDQGRLVYTAPPTQSPITSILVNKTGSKLIGCGLDKAIYVWSIVRDYKLKSQNIILQRKIQNNSTISGIVSSQILAQLIVISTKDGKIKLVNIQKGQSYKTISIYNQNQAFNVATSYPLELTIIQRDNKPYYPLAFVWPYKQQKIYQINTQSTLVGVKNLNNNSATLQFGYGVGPKCFYVSDTGRGALLYSVNHRPSSGSCMSVYRIQELR